jgi:signal peptide peptidase SppA
MYERILAAVAGSVWAIEAAKLQAILAVLELRAAGGRVSDEEIRAIAGAAQQPMQRQQGAVAVLPLYGTISQRMGLMTESSGGTSTQAFSKMFRQAVADPSVGAIVLDVDSPGGSVFGVQELASEIYAARGPKPIVAVANSLAASAAYWIASAADEFSVTPSGEVGSIGVIAVHEDASGAYEQMGVRHTLITAGKYKGEANPYQPLNDDDREALQASVNEYYDAFVGAVAKYRGATPADVRGGYGQGRVVSAREAKRLGMVDKVETLDDAIGRLMKRRPVSAGAGVRSDADEVPTPTAEATLPTIWRDLSGNGNDAVQVESDKQPTLHTPPVEVSNTPAVDPDLDRRMRRLRLAGAK